MQISQVLIDESVVEHEIAGIVVEVEPAFQNNLDAIAVIEASYKSTR